MQAFSALFEQLDRTNGTNARVAALEAYFRQAPPADAAWALELLLGRRRRRLITGRRLLEILVELGGLPSWLVDDCHAQVGDSAETIALLLPGGDPPQPLEQPLHRWMERTLPELAALQGQEQVAAVAAVWQAVPRHQLLVLNKLLTGGFRVGVAAALVLRALASVSGLETSLLAHRLMGGFAPSAHAFEALVAPAGHNDATAISRPYPFLLASPLESRITADWEPRAWRAEWKWDGIRGQLIRRQGTCFLWSRGEELVNESFPELVHLGEALPDGTVLDGEVIVWGAGEERPRGFAALQRRLGRRSVSRTLRQDYPMAFIAYDLLELHGLDRREEPLHERLGQLQDLAASLQAGDHPERERLRLSQEVPFGSWQELDLQREQARAVGAEGLMIKRLASPYLAGRRRGHWWKHKLQPMELDAVLLYAQAGSGRRANLFTDYTFALWNGSGNLVTFAKAYSGLDDGEIHELDRWIRRHTTERFGPVRAVEPLQVFTLGFEGIQRSARHKSGLAVRFPRILRWRRDKPAVEADSLDGARTLLEGTLP